MKRIRNKYSMLVWALCFWTLAGCDSYLDVNPKGTLEQEKQFEDVQDIVTRCTGFMRPWLKRVYTGKL